MRTWGGTCFLVASDHCTKAGMPLQPRTSFLLLAHHSQLSARMPVQLRSNGRARRLACSASPLVRNAHCPHAMPCAGCCGAGGKAADAALLRQIGQAFGSSPPDLAACNTASWGAPNAYDACGANDGSAWAGVECRATGSFRDVVGVTISGCGVGPYTSELVPLTALAALTRLVATDSALQVKA